MCGRLACGLQPDDICNACCYIKGKNINFTRPEWKTFLNNGKAYKPSYNICPTEVAPVLLSGRHFDSELRVVAPMVFGLIPSWAQEGERNTYSTINCKLETMKTSKLYGKILEKGQRCVVVCNGFYEWQKQENTKSPYFIHFQQSFGIKVEDPDTWNIKCRHTEGYKGFKLLKMAALFDKRTCNKTGESTFSFTIITKEASNKMNWLHNRVPAILETDEQLDTWLNNTQLDTELFLHSISITENITWFPVSHSVNKTENKDTSCIKRCEIKKHVSSKASETFLKAWLQKGLKRNEDKEFESNLKKVQKEKSFKCSNFKQLSKNSEKKPPEVSPASATPALINQEVSFHHQPVLRHRTNLPSH